MSVTCLVFQVEKCVDGWEDDGRGCSEADTMQLQPLIGTVTSFDGDFGYVNESTYFSQHSLSDGTDNLHTFKTKLGLK